MAFAGAPVERHREFEMPTDGPSAELPDNGRVAKIGAEIDAAGKHPHAAFRRGKQRRLDPRRASRGIGAQNQRGLIEPSPRLVVADMPVAAHEQLRQAIIFDRKVRANLLTAKYLPASSLRSVHCRRPRYS